MKYRKICFLFLFILFVFSSCAENIVPITDNFEQQTQEEIKEEPLDIVEQHTPEISEEGYELPDEIEEVIFHALVVIGGQDYDIEVVHYIIHLDDSYVFPYNRWCSIKISKDGECIREERISSPSNTQTGITFSSDRTDELVNLYIWGDDALITFNADNRGQYIYSFYIVTIDEITYFNMETGNSFYTAESLLEQKSDYILYEPGTANELHFDFINGVLEFL
ncbi:MAG: hypothetical protein FWE74_06155 [Oscillospiraceae bacterium]|nr:hypothetical protein [Oscillospiraceae bacterium]